MLHLPSKNPTPCSLNCFTVKMFNRNGNSKGSYGMIALNSAPFLCLHNYHVITVNFKSNI